MADSAVPHYDSLAGAISSLFGRQAAVAHRSRVFGGDINTSYALTLTSGERVFMKANARENAAFFTAEAAGLLAIAGTGAIGTPRILCTGTDGAEPGGCSFLLLEFIASGKRRADYFSVLARDLAAMHGADSAPFTGGGAFGFLQDNFIGARAQENTVEEGWIPFFRMHRLLPQFKAADRYFSPADRARNARLLDQLDRFFVEPERPSLVHGDLWGGNVLPDKDGRALLIDPAVYVGHAEADLAMTELFGGFPPAFYAAYRECRPLQDGYEDRRDLYNLYQLLNHLNLFGASYLEPVNRIVARYAG